jgi:6,7-dimethyl-8-ribityllumazine synthase
VRTIEGAQTAAGYRFAVVVSTYNDFVTGRLLEGALSALNDAGADTNDITVIRVPGAFEIPIAARRAGDSREYDAIVCLGCIIRGETPHFEYLASAVSQGLTAAAVATGVPITFGVLTTNSIEQAIARAGQGASNKGWEAAQAAIEMAVVIGRLGRPSPTR